MALILNIETSTKTCSVAISRNSKILSLVEQTNNNFAHSEKLNEFIQECLKEANVTFADLQAVAVSEGPGSYTGLRIGVSTAKGLCYALNIPLLSISTLKSMSLLAKTRTETDCDIYIPMIDARRMEVFCAGFDSELNPVFNTRAQIINEDSFELINKKACFFGDGAAKCIEIFQNRTQLFFLPDITASAKGMASLADEKFHKADFADLAYFEPFYLKDFIAGKKKKTAN